MLDDLKTTLLLFKKTSKFYFDHFFIFLKLFLIALIPLWIVLRVGAGTFDFQVIRFALNTGMNIPFFDVFLPQHKFFILALVIVIVSAAVFIIYQAVIFITIQNIVEKKQVKVIENYKRSFFYIPKISYIVLLLFSYVLLWSVLLIVPGIVCAILYSLCVVAFICSGKEGKEALKHSQMLVLKKARLFCLGVTMTIVLMLLLDIAFYAFVEYIFAVHINCSYTVKQILGEAFQDTWTILLSTYVFVFIFWLYKEIERQIFA